MYRCLNQFCETGVFFYRSSLSQSACAPQNYMDLMIRFRTTQRYSDCFRICDKMKYVRIYATKPILGMNLCFCISTDKLPYKFYQTNSISGQSTQPFQCDIFSTTCAISDGAIDLAYRYESVTTVNTNPSEPIKDKAYANLTGVYIPGIFCLN